MWLGVDVGSVSVDTVLINDKIEVFKSAYLLTAGMPIEAIKEGLRKSRDSVPVLGVGTTGSGRELAAVLTNADIVKNEITAHAIAAAHFVPDVRTVIEIGGQDSKIIILKDGIPVDFAMNTVCAAGTGSFLDHQAQRLGIPIEKFGQLALQSKSPARIAGRCTVFAESDMIHKQQLGYGIEDIIAGLCKSLVRNYLVNVAKGKPILPPIVFQGGVASNEGIRKALEEELGMKVFVPTYNKLMGAIGAAMLAKKVMKDKRKTSFRGFDICDMEFNTQSFICEDCPNTCEIVKISSNGKVLATWGSRCGKWDLSK
ncbi:2-hydroxyglutaryl-CoA dehydratase [candidate division WOR-3 bacterium]|nr:2-hydroxyglutaryl-CoA dehydratase [candidate division WOR-3 bacterium]